ncbi:hypothetical protein Cgig2_019203 [Carnegiea gigantea]|uniref:Uncharacterized protein n=1 Tax=Carnegiea gigantea TaxID=171969 RepID=A0A9Q1JJM7_9CARY|nr:hypothetical protein Cgig2_019203 [Carnegiea gigantea]
MPWREAGEVIGRDERGRANGGGDEEAMRNDEHKCRVPASAVSGAGERRGTEMGTGEKRGVWLGKTLNRDLHRCTPDATTPACDYPVRLPFQASGQFESPRLRDFEYFQFETSSGFQGSFSGELCFPATFATSFNLQGSEFLTLRSGFWCRLLSLWNVDCVIVLHLLSFHDLTMEQPTIAIDESMVPSDDMS